MLKTAAPPERSISDRLEVGDGEGDDGVGSDGEFVGFGDGGGDGSLNRKIV